MELHRRFAAPYAACDRKGPAHLAVWLFASHMTMSQASSALEHDAVATLLTHRREQRSGELKMQLKLYRR
jgi:hypothetical protein